MKKLLSFLAAGALAFGLAGCSGNLHDLEASPLGVVGFDSGSTNKVVLMKMDTDDGSEQSLTFTWSSSSTVTAADGTLFNVQEGWGKAGGVQFKIILPDGIKADGTPDWSKDLSYTDTMTYITPGAAALALHPRGENGYSGAEGQNISVTGLSDGQEYVLKALYDSAAGKVQVYVEGVVANPEACRIMFYTSRELKKDGEGKPVTPNVYEYKNEHEKTNFPLKDKDGKDIVRTMTKKGNDYIYSFIATEAEKDLKFVISNDILGDSSVYDLKDIKKDFEYEITFTKVNDNTTYSYKLKNITRLPVLRYGEIITNSNHSEDAYAEYSILNLKTNWLYGDGSNDAQSLPYWDGKSYWSDAMWYGNDYNLVVFKAPSEEFEMTVNRIAGSSDMAWGKKTADIEAGKDAVELLYVNKNDKDNKNTLAPVKIKGLTKNGAYILEFSGNFDNKVDLSAQVSRLDSEDDLNRDLSEIFLVGGITESSSTAEKITIALEPANYGYKVPVRDGKFEFIFTYAGKDSWGGGAGEHAFTIMDGPAVGWTCSKRWGGAAKMSNGTVGAYTAIKDVNNIVLTGMVKDKKYTLSGTVYDKFIDMTLTEAK